MNINDYKNLIDGNPMHIATVREDNKPNLSVAADVKVIENNKIIISVNEMVNTPKNIEKNHNVVLTVFDSNWVGLRIFGEAKFYNNGKYYDLCKKTFFSNNEVTSLETTVPKGVIVVDVIKVEEFK